MNGIPPFAHAREDVSLPALEELTFLQRNFVIQYVLGDDGIRGVAYKAYIAAGYTASTIQVAATASYALIRHPKVSAAIAALQAEIERTARMRMKSWAEGAVKAQEALFMAIETVTNPDAPRKVFLSANQIAVIREVLDRALGRPKQKHEMGLGEGLEDAIKRLADATSAATAPKQLEAGDPHFLGSVESAEVVPASIRLLEDDER